MMIKNITSLPLKSGRRTITVDAPLVAGGEERESGTPHWSGYRDCVSAQSMLLNHPNFGRSGPPARLMEWRDGAWAEAPAHALSAARSAFSRRSPTAEVHVDGRDCVLDFYRMLLIDLSDGLQRSIAWIDVNGGCFFPKFFVDESVVDDEGVGGAEGENPKIEIEIEIKLDANSNEIGDNCDELIAGEKRKRRDMGRDEDYDTADSSSNYNSNYYRRNSDDSKRRCVVPPAARVLEWPNSRAVSEGERAHAVVTQLFMAGMKAVDPGVRITGIRQFARTGPVERARWESFHKQMEMTGAVRGRSNAVFAWYGASRRGVVNVLARGFGQPSKVPGPQGHGVGVYLSHARLPQLSNALAEVDENGEQHVVLCRVVLGRVEEVEAGSKQFFPSSVDFDNGVDNLANPKWYVVWTTNMNTHILPECVISYKRCDHEEGQKKEAEFMTWVPKGSTAVVTKFFSKLESSLPAFKREELKALCMTYKAGKMAKEHFIRELKSIVGDELLRSTISEIQGPN